MTLPRRFLTPEDPRLSMNETGEVKWFNWCMPVSAVTKCGKYEVREKAAFQCADSHDINNSIYCFHCSFNLKGKKARSRALEMFFGVCVCVCNLSAS